MAFLIGLALVCALGVGHHFGILAVRAIVPRPARGSHAAIVGAFLGIVALHLLEILAFAGVYRILLDLPWMGELAIDDGETWGDLVYFSGINFTTLGYTSIDAAGPIRMVNMMQSLGGFMVLTWSATFMYSYWSRAWGH